MTTTDPALTLARSLLNEFQAVRDKTRDPEQYMEAAFEMAAFTTNETRLAELERQASQ